MLLWRYYVTLKVNNWLPVMWHYVSFGVLNHTTRTFVSFGRDREAVKMEKSIKTYIVYVIFSCKYCFNIVFTHCIFQPCYKWAQWFCVWSWEWRGKWRRWLHCVWMSWTGFSKYCDMKNQLRLNFEQISTNSIRMFFLIHCIALPQHRFRSQKQIACIGVSFGPLLPERKECFFN
jgi:hypothetical protein